MVADKKNKVVETYEIKAGPHKSRKAVNDELREKLPEILNKFEQEKMKQVETIKKDLTDLQTMIKEYK